MPKHPSTLHTGDFENKPPIGQGAFPGPGVDKLQLSSPGAPLPVARGVPDHASPPSTCQQKINHLGRQVRPAVEELLLWGALELSSTCKEYVPRSLVCSPELSLARQTPGLAEK